MSLNLKVSLNRVVALCVWNVHFMFFFFFFQLDSLLFLPIENNKMIKVKISVSFIIVLDIYSDMTFVILLWKSNNHDRNAQVRGQNIIRFQEAQVKKIIIIQTYRKKQSEGMARI